MTQAGSATWETGYTAGTSERANEKLGAMRAGLEDIYRRQENEPEG